MNSPNPKPQRSPSYVLVGPLRAGTTLLHLMLNNHPQIASVGEFEESAAMLDDQGWPSLELYRTWLSGHRVANSRNYTSNPETSSYPELVSDMWSQLARTHDQPIVGCTIHSRFDRIHELWPDAKFIYLTRDPRDVANSCVGMGWVGHAARGAAIWIQSAQRWNKVLKQVPDTSRIQIRYEDLLEHPERQLTRCCELLGLGYDPEMLEYHKVSSYQPLNPKLAYQWQRKMKPRTAQLIDFACEQWMHEHGYEPSTPHPKPIGALESLIISLRNRIGRFGWRINRYGLGLTLRWAMVKRLSLDHPLRAAANRRINEIDTTHLR